ncbi:hypothetical protein OCGS_0531 [Oceaniovalibus guishaninsula JLT2003]|uniref:Hda lid domain-containing protein n=1 Tax=Oceaniovalibus guishaninsula JLT2003 TaxID=1231392 RepID=K2GS32_9RHOB|nr:DnaA/Hda family protein [Oceaniovalibus guishaninsula]EKE45441.1 hypothetical protein OCGS_0531 [Oceaniovalibus guishaninsula JLT2003]
MTAQMAFDLPVRPAFGREDFVVSPANAATVAMVETPKLWPGGRLALTGPEASGKSHLAQVWATGTDAVIVAARDLARLDVPTLASARRLVVEDVPLIGGQRRAEAAMFHLYNLLGAAHGRLLFTGRGPVAGWGLSLPDLASRLQSATAVALPPPDDALLRALLAKHMRDRQVPLTEAVADYVVSRMTRSAARAHALAVELNRLSLARRRPVTIPLARDALLALGDGG